MILIIQKIIFQNLMWKNRWVSVFVVAFLLGCSKPVQPIIEKPSSLNQWVLLKDKGSVEYSVRDVFIQALDSSESIWKEGVVQLKHIKDSLSDGVSFFQYQVEMFDNTGKSIGIQDTFWLWQLPKEEETIYVKGDGLSLMPRFIALKRGTNRSVINKKHSSSELLDTLRFPFFSSVQASWSKHTGILQEVNRRIRTDTVYSLGGKQYDVWHIERTLSYQNKIFSKVNLFYGALGLMYSEQIWSDVNWRKGTGVVSKAGTLKRIYELQ